MNQTMPTAEYVRAYLRYDPQTGLITRVAGVGRRCVSGAVAGTKHSRGYWVVGLGGKNYKAHRVAWLLYYGEWPQGEIDHINGVKTDNRIENLRVVTRSENMTNMTAARSDNRLGVRGVTQIGNRFIARFRDRYLGIFRTIAEAKSAYLLARQQGEIK